MHRSRFLPALRLALAGLLAVSAIALLGQPVVAQDARGLKLKLHISFKNTAKDAVGGVTLRPNVPQEVFVFVENEDPDNDQEVTVELHGGGAPELTQKLTAKKGEKTLVSWEKAPAVAKALAGAASFRVRNKDGKYDSTREAPLQVARPRSYIEVASALFSPGDPNRFAITATPKKGQTAGGQPAKLELDISREGIPTLAPGQKKVGRYAGFLPLEEGLSLTLEARGLKFADTRDTREGVVFVTVDGYKRAIIADTTFASSGKDATPDTADDAALSLPLPAFSRPAQLAVPVHADGNISWDDRIKVQVLAGTKKTDKGEEKVWAEVAEFTGPREVKATYARGSTGGLAFTAATNEWKAGLDFSGVFDKTEVRLLLLGADGKAKPVRNGATRSREKGEGVVQSITFDDSPPDKLVLTGAVPREAYRGLPLAIKVDAEDGESGVSEVYFHLGKPAEAGKLPPGTVRAAAQRVENSTSVWEGELPIPGDAKGPLDVTVVAVNGVGLSKSLTLTLPVGEPKASISGRVHEMDVAIDNLPVVLLTLEGRELKMERTAGGGKYLFTGLEPGSYALFARREQNGFRKLLAPVIVKGKEQLVDRDLSLEPPPEAIKEKEKKARKASISGVVMEGPRPQAGVKLRLFDLNAKKEVATATTDASGRYVFKDLEKGKYQVFATRSASFTKARKDVDVDAGEDKTVDLKLFR